MDIKFSGSDAGGFQFDPNAAPKPKRERKPRKSIGSKGGRIAVNTLVTLLVGAVFFYVQLPAINLHAEEFYGFVLLLCVTYCICALFTSGFQGTGAKGYFTFVKKQCTVPFFVVAALIVTALVGALTSWVVLRAKDYQALLPIESGSFASEIEEVSYDRIPMLDRDSAEKLGDRKLGELADMVSQFEVAENYTQINYHGRPVRVTPLRYGDIIKWFNNRSEGLPAYLIIDMVTQNVEVVRLDEGMKYTTAEHFSRNLYRHLRFAYPTYMFEEPVFEIDEDGTPYWVCAKKEKTIGLFGGTDNHGAVLVNAITGESEYYEEPPAWVVFILCTVNSERLLPTVRSRCTEISSGGEKQMDAAMKKLASDYLKAVAAGDRLRLFRWCTANEGMDVRDAADFVACAGELLTEMLCMREKNPGIDRAEILRLGTVLSRCGAMLQVNTGVKHIFGLLAVESLPTA